MLYFEVYSSHIARSPVPGFPCLGKFVPSCFPSGDAGLSAVALVEKVLQGVAHVEGPGCRTVVCFQVHH